jgi:hypothetical protein
MCAHFYLSTEKYAVFTLLPKNPLFQPNYYIIFLFFLINLRKKVGFWAFCYFLAYYRYFLWPKMFQKVGGKWVFGHKISRFRFPNEKFCQFLTEIANKNGQKRKTTKKYRSLSLPELRQISTQPDSQHEHNKAYKQTNLSLISHDLLSLLLRK